MKANRSPWRAAAGAVIVVLAALAIRHFCVQPYRCAAALPSLQAATFRAAEQADTQRGVMMARRNLERLAALDGACRQELEWMMLEAGNSRIAGDAPRAIALYTHALTLHQRPELYFNRGVAYLEMRQVDRAVQDLATAAIFNPTILENFDADTQKVIREAMAARQ